MPHFRAFGFKSRTEYNSLAKYRRDEEVYFLLALRELHLVLILDL